MGYYAPMRSREIISSQKSSHKSLNKVLARHSQNLWQQPIKAHTREAFNAFLGACQSSLESGFILDAGCGTGASSLLLAQQHPDKFVLGIDKSPQRLGRGELTVGEKDSLSNGLVQRDNWALLRAEVADFWRLLAEYKLIPEKICIYYPNPWPKSAHFKRRWHGHPVFPTLLKLGAPIEVRSNWKIYLDEFALATEIITGQLPVVERLSGAELESGSVSPFEKKYFQSGHDLWSLMVAGDTNLAPIPSFRGGE